MSDPYLYEDSTVLRNRLNITNVQELDLAEAELSRASMMLLYDEGFSDFSVRGLRQIHKALFGDVYDWAGEFRIINLQKREEILGGKSVWYSNDEDIERDLSAAWQAIDTVAWSQLSCEEFAQKMAQYFPALWQTHPFREGNTRTVVMLMTFFVEHYGYYFDQELLAASAGYVRNAFVMASIGEQAEYSHLERILCDAIADKPVSYADDNHAEPSRQERYEQYLTVEYTPRAHEYRPDDTNK